jgi:hypothetical protein
VCELSLSREHGCTTFSLHRRGTGVCVSFLWIEVCKLLKFTHIYVLSGGGGGGIVLKIKLKQKGNKK